MQNATSIPTTTAGKLTPHEAAARYTAQRMLVAYLTRYVHQPFFPVRVGVEALPRNRHGHLIVRFESQDAPGKVLPFRSVH